MHPFIIWSRKNWALFLILLSFLLFCTHTLFIAPMLMMAIIGISRVIEKPSLIKSRELHIFFALFACMWLPMLLSLIGAIEPYRAIKTTLYHLGYLFAGIFIIDAIKTKEHLRVLNVGLMAIIIFFCLDALLQFFRGTNLLSYPYIPGLLSGIFYPKQALSHFLALLSPLFFEAIRLHRNKILVVLLFLVYTSVIFLSGKRAAWLMFISSSAIYIAYAVIILKINWKPLGMLCIATITCITIIYAKHQPIQGRVSTMIHWASGPFTESVPLNQRVYLWKTGLNILHDHWINGIGIRGFRYAYKKYAPANDPLMIKGITAHHPHLILLEILVESGIIGLISYLIFWLLIIKYARRLLLENTSSGIPWLIVVIVAILPYNSHMAFYGSYWSSLVWLTIPIFIASLKNSSCKDSVESFDVCQKIR